MTHLTRDDFQALTDWWKERLGLPHWEFKVQLWTRRAADEHNAYAQLDACWEKRIAWLCVLDPADAEDSQSLTTYDPEVSVVHELLHVYTEQMHPKKRRSPENIKAEQLAHFVSLALVKLKRETEQLRLSLDGAMTEVLTRDLCDNQRRLLGATNGALTTHADVGPTEP